MSPFKDYEVMCPKCGSENIFGEGARHEGYLWRCLDCGCASWSKTRFKKSRVLQMKKWRNKKQKESHPPQCTCEECRAGHIEDTSTAEQQRKGLGVTQ